MAGFPDPATSATAGLSGVAPAAVATVHPCCCLWFPDRRPDMPSGDPDLDRLVQNTLLTLFLGAALATAFFACGGWFFPFRLIGFP